jgi:hypothetical protein
MRSNRSRGLCAGAIIWLSHSRSNANATFINGGNLPAADAQFKANADETQKEVGKPLTLKTRY